ncbi:MAG TPA: division plane positioning ATPase MipZ [Sphingomonas sp.]
MTRPGAHFIVFANEKGGTGKSTTAVHVAVALAAQGRRVATIDLDTRQKTVARYLENRVATARRENIELVTPLFEVFDPARDPDIERRLDRLAEDAEFVIVDTPGRDDPYAMKAVARADTLVTPINDSFIDLDLIGQVDPDTYRIKRPSFYAEVVWDARKARAKSDGGTVDWVVLRNRLQHLEARNMRRVGQAVDELSKRVGFRVIPGLGERVIYRELFPKGLTLLDLGAIKEAGLSHVAARQELREMVSALQLPEAADLFNRSPPASAAATA